MRLSKTKNLSIEGEALSELYDKHFYVFAGPRNRMVERDGESTVTHWFVYRMGNQVKATLYRTAQTQDILEEESQTSHAYIGDLSAATRDSIYRALDN